MKVRLPEQGPGSSLSISDLLHHLRTSCTQVVTRDAASYDNNAINTYE